jgi:5'-3' exoribonuclease 1
LVRRLPVFSLSHPLTFSLDNLYLDFNGIIHTCESSALMKIALTHCSKGSHPNDDDAHFRMTENQIFTSIFTYVDHLFGKIKPKKLFFMAVDGVAPRAKMNQQRSRRFRTAKEAREVREKAERKGEKLPDEKAFDSNCITPGAFSRLQPRLPLSPFPPPPRHLMDSGHNR